MPETLASGTALVPGFTSAEIPLSTADGAAHIFVNPTTGNDTTGNGLTAATAFRTISRAIDRANEWLELFVDADIVVELANGSYAETVKCFLSQIPRRRVFFRGDRLSMTVVDSGTAGAGTGANAIADPTKAFTVDVHARLILHTFDPLNRAATEQYATIRTNTATVLEPPESFSPIAAIGWTYEILRPAVVITTNPNAQDAPGFNAVLPWSNSLAQAGEFAQDGPCLHLNFIQFGKIDLGGLGYAALQVEGGSVAFVGCLAEVILPNDSVDCVLLNQSSAISGFGSFTADPVYGTALSGTMFNLCGLGCGGSGNLGSWLNCFYSTFLGRFVGREPSGTGGITAVYSQVTLEGGSCIGPTTNLINEHSVLTVFLLAGGSLPFLFKGSAAAGALLVRRKSYVELFASAYRFTSLLGDAIAVTLGAYVRLLGNPVANVPGDILGNCCDVATGGQVAATGVTAAVFQSTGANADADGTTTGGGAWVAAPATIRQSTETHARVYQI